MKPHIALVGLNFGAQWVPCYRDHPDVGAVTLLDLATAANWTAAGISAHQSALQEGTRIEVPQFAV